MFSFFREITGIRSRNLILEVEPDDDETSLLKKGVNRIKQFSSVAGIPTLKFRCDKSGLLRTTELKSSGTAKEIWELNTEVSCSICGGKHRVFVA